METTLDVRDMTPKNRHPRIFKIFNNLNAGESFILINDHDPKPLLYQFQAEHHGEFDWWPLESGPHVWRVAIAKRESSGPRRTVTEYMQTDHKRLDSIFGRFLVVARKKRWEEAAKCFREFMLGLKRHIRVEEDILFPIFEQKTGMRESGPTAVMRGDHKELQKLLDKVLSNTEAGNAAMIESASSALINILKDHNMKEEHILYPESDGFLSETERSEVVKKAQLI